MVIIIRGKFLVRYQYEESHISMYFNLKNKTMKL